MLANITQPRILKIGGGGFAETGALLRQLGLSRPLIVSDGWLAGSGLVARLADQLAGQGMTAGIFTETVPDPTTQSIDRGVAALAAGAYDCLIALGGGSPIDSAKAMAALHRQGGRMRDYKAPFVNETPGLPVIAIPTTAGTGSEVTRFAIITDSETDEKMLCVGPAFVPLAAIVDYELTLTKSQRLTADTGIDSLTHAIEAFVSRKANAYTDAMALSAMKIIYENIRTVCADPGNRPAREQMMLGATLAGIAFSNASVALVHGMSRPVGALFHVPHGLSNAMLLPAVTAFSLDAAEARYAICARTIGAAPAGADDGRAAAALVAALEWLNADLDVPTPREYGIGENSWFGNLAVMARQALESGSPGNNPRVPNAAEIEELYRQVWR